MRKDYEKLFTHLKPPEPPTWLLGAIMARIHEEEQLFSVKKRLAIFSTMFLASAGAFVSAFRLFQDGFVESGFLSFSSLIFSDLNLVVANWQDFGLALLEALPAFSIMVVLATMFMLLWSLKNIMQTSKSIFYQPRFINN